MRWSWLCPLFCCLAATAQAPTKKAAPEPDTKSKAAPRRFTEFPVPEPEALDVDRATKDGIAAMLLLQEGEDGDQWPYEGVYREDRGLLPVGYRVGGTSIACLGLIAAPGYRTDAARQAAVARGLAFVLKTLDAPRMAVEFQGTYDVRGWGHIYALELLLHLQDAGLVPAEQRELVEAKAKWLVGALCDSAIPVTGGWNYSRPRGYKSPQNRASTFMTAPALQALFHARARGHDVLDAVVTQALDALDRARAMPGGYAYGAPAESQAEVEEAQLSMMDKTPSSAARATVCETTLLLAGRGDMERLEAAIDRFFAHWDDLAVRKSQTGTHIKPYGIAPYYFLFGHLYVAQAIEQLPDAEKRAKLRAQLRQFLARSREEDGSWNDRQFGRSGGYGTALALMVMHMAHLPKPASWSASEAK
ncbi:MAG: hypothetical protein H6838_07490 [Planctomycetes bacterium]|nr:hypothetical protein [Planctomycetota bacterium]MCB9885318.1 hypothetical protein [Planctomycetota bacterium]